MVKSIETCIPIRGVSQKGELNVIASEKKPGDYELMFVLHNDTYSETVKACMTSISRGTAIFYENEKRFIDGGKENVEACLSLKENDSRNAVTPADAGEKLKFELLLCQNDSVTLTETDGERKNACRHINETICAMQEIADELTGVGKIKDELPLAMSEAVESTAEYDEALLSDIMSRMPDKGHLDEIDQNDLDALLEGL